MPLFDVDCVLFKKEGPSYNCFANYSIQAPPNVTVREVLELLKEQASVLPQSTSVTYYGVCGPLIRVNASLRTLQILGAHQGIGKKTVKEARERLPLDDTSVRDHRSLLLGSCLEEGSVLGIVFSESLGCLLRRCYSHQFIHRRIGPRATTHGT
jgi:hypothetical protein